MYIAKESTNFSGRSYIILRTKQEEYGRIEIPLNHGISRSINDMTRGRCCCHGERPLSWVDMAKGYGMFILPEPIVFPCSEMLKEVLAAGDFVCGYDDSWPVLLQGG